ncbi:MAG TPA: Fis family transcriptional regulator [Sulfurovum sp. UBA12169]|nr:MAG TPA: Fis family transcriptional regulator [Sulfurovum sp. UBA12169]
MEQFYTKSEQIQNIIKGLNLTRTLFVSSIILGEAHTGKKTLVRTLFPDTTTVSGTNQKEVEDALKEYDELIITDFEKLNNQNKFQFDNKRVIAVANHTGNQEIIDKLFAFIYMLPPLRDRTEDARYMKALFFKEACTVLMKDEHSLSLESIATDLSDNNQSLKKSVYEQVIYRNMHPKEIEQVLYTYLLEHLEGNNAYKEYLGLYEKPLIEAGLKKFRSQLQLSQVLGINRNTLRKKIYEYRID